MKSRKERRRKGVFKSIEGVFYHSDDTVGFLNTDLSWLIDKECTFINNPDGKYVLIKVIE